MLTGVRERRPSFAGNGDSSAVGDEMSSPG